MQDFAPPVPSLALVARARKTRAWFRVRVGASPLYMYICICTHPTMRLRNFVHIHIHSHFRAQVRTPALPQQGCDLLTARFQPGTNIPTHGKASTCYPRTYAQQGSDLHGNPVAVPELNKEGVLQVGDGNWPTLKNIFGGRRSSQSVLLLPPGPRGMREGTQGSLGECQRSDARPAHVPEQLQ